MRDRRYTDAQFNQILEILIMFKKCCPETEVSLTETSFLEATAYFQKSGVFESLLAKSEPKSEPKDEPKSEPKDEPKSEVGSP
jgi:hypothetical protein